MKNKYPLALMEQLIMLMVFAIAAALCLQIFALSGRISRDLETRDRAMMTVQNAAESIKIAEGDLAEHAVYFGGNVTDGVWTVYFDENWQTASVENAVYSVTAHITENDIPLLGTAEVCAKNADGTALFELTAAWQEVAE